MFPENTHFDLPGASRSALLHPHPTGFTRGPLRDMEVHFGIARVMETESPRDCRRPFQLSPTGSV
jgi:hypothetical protein